MKNCQENITSQCKKTVEVPSDCNETASAFVTKYDNCKKESGIAKQCSCFEGILSNYSSVKKCLKTTNEAFSKANKEKNTCNTAFKGCKDQIPVTLNATKSCEVGASTTTTARPASGRILKIMRDQILNRNLLV